MRSEVALLAIVLGIAGCVIGHFEDPKPGQYADYRAFAYDRAKAYTLKGIPDDLNHELQICTVDTSMDYMTPVELERWNAYARGETKIPQSEFEAYDRELQSRMGDDAISQMRKKCPSTMTELDKYKT